MNDLEDIDECLRWMKEGRAVRIRWQSGCTAWTVFDSEIGKPVAVDGKSVSLSSSSSDGRRHISGAHQDQSPISVVDENLVTPNA